MFGCDFIFSPDFSSTPSNTIGADSPCLVDSSKLLGHFVLEQQTIDPVIACFTSSMATQADTIGRTAVPLPPPVNDALQSPVKCRAIYARVDMSTAVCLTAPVYAAMLLW